MFGQRHGWCNARPQVGFRTARIADGALLHNNARVMLRGVNRHEWHERRGKVRRTPQHAQQLPASMHAPGCCPQGAPPQGLLAFATHAGPHPQVLDEEHMVQDIALMKAANINAMRCSHYPNATRW